MRKKTFKNDWKNLVILILFLLLMFMLYNQKQSFFNNLYNKYFKTTTTNTTVLKTNKSPVFITKTLKEDDLKYTLNGTYPYFGIDFVDKDIKQALDTAILEFKNNATQIFDPNFEKAELTILFKDYLINNNIISLRFIISNYTGGAHGNQYIITKNYNLKSQKEITFDAMFKGDYLNFISNWVILDLIKRFPDNVSWIKEGAGAKASNFENITFDKDNSSIVFHFDPYQVAPYSSGIVEAKIDLNVLKPYLK